MKLGINLSFAAKRWQDPVELAELCANFKVHYWQFNFDLVDPWWPESIRDPLCEAYYKAFTDRGLCFDSAFGGLAAYSYPQLLAYSPKMREASLIFQKRSIDTTLLLGAKTLGIAVGGMTHQDAYNPARRETAYKNLITSLMELADYGYQKGLNDIQIEATPLFTEIPYDPETSLRLMQDLDRKSAIPIKIFLDWGHVLYEPLLKEQADMACWIKILKPYLGDMHLQQTDGQGDRHWDFRRNGIITNDLIVNVLRDGGVEDKIQYLEFSPAFEATDDNVLDGMLYSVQQLRTVFKD